MRLQGPRSPCRGWPKRKSRLLSGRGGRGRGGRRGAQGLGRDQAGLASLAMRRVEQRLQRGHGGVVRAGSGRRSRTSARTANRPGSRRSSTRWPPMNSNTPAGKTWCRVAPTAIGCQRATTRGISHRFMNHGVTSTPSQWSPQGRKPTASTDSAGLRIGTPAIRCCAMWRKVVSSAASGQGRIGRRRGSAASVIEHQEVLLLRRAVGAGPVRGQLG